MQWIMASGLGLDLDLDLDWIESVRGAQSLLLTFGVETCVAFRQEEPVSETLRSRSRSLFALVEEGIASEVGS